MTPSRPEPTSIRAVGPWRVDRAPAKVNLGLRIVGRRDDGYHLLDSLVVFAGVGDHVALAPSDGAMRSTLRGPFAGALTGGDTLLTDAVKAFRDAFGGPARQSRLWKRLPVAAGIGGGSADAAAALRILASETGVPLDDPKLLDLALALGADTPMCLVGRAARIGGVGERLAPAPALPPLPAVLVNPGVPVSTPAVFKARSGPFSAEATLARRYDDVPALAADLASFGNDLEASALSLAPEIDDARAALRRTALFTSMSGSGATCFGLYATPADARDAARRIRTDRPEWWVAPTTLR